MKQSANSVHPYNLANRAFWKASNLISKGSLYTVRAPCSNFQYRETLRPWSWTQQVGAGGYGR